jgi:hypothetical protein
VAVAVSKNAAVTLTQPIEPASLLQENLGTAIEEILGLAELASASFVVAATDVFGRSTSKDIPSSSHGKVSVVFHESEIVRISVLAQMTPEAGEKVGVASLTLEFVECKATANVKPQLGLDRDAMESLARRMVAQFPYRDFVGGTQDPEAEKLRAEVARIRDEVQADRADVRVAKEAANQLLADQRATLQESAIKHHAQVFKNEASDHHWRGVFWLAVAGFAALGLFLVALTFVNDNAALPSFSERAFTLHILERVTLLSILATIVGVSVRLHRASLHNWVVATHRSNALQAYEAFAAATKDKPGADELLAQALALVFTPKDTGYSKVSGAPDGAQIFTEIAKRTLGPKAG